jgi:hypothetical protein
MTHDASAPPLDPTVPLPAHLHIFVAFDWGDEVDLERAAQLAPGEFVSLSRRPRTPTSITYKPPPLRVRLAPVKLSLPGCGDAPIELVEATVFDFAAVSVSLELPLRLSRDGLTQLAGRLADPDVSRLVIRTAYAALGPLYEKVLPAIQKPQWVESFSEEYYVFHFKPGSPLCPEPLLGDLAGWAAGLLRLEDQPLSADEVAEAARLSLRYGRDDLFLPDWAAAVLLDYEQECQETLQTIEFANLQLLEYRQIDDRLDGSLAQANRVMARLEKSRLPLWRGQDAALRAVGDLKVEATGLFERTGNVFKLIGDQYLARAYRLLATRFHLRDWERSIQRKLDVIEGIYEVVSNRTVTFRTEFLEIIVIFLIMLEIVLALVHR